MSPLRIHKAWAIVLMLVCAGCSTVGHKQVGIDNFDQVSADLFRGAQPNEAGFRALADQHVRTIINLRDDANPREAEMVRQAGMAYLQLPMNAETVTVADAEHFLKLLKTAEAPVFVHCHAGRDRTGLAIAAYRIRIQGWSQEAALRDLYDHGHLWVLYPKVRQVIGQLGQTPQPERQLASSTPYSN